MRRRADLDLEPAAPDDASGACPNCGAAASGAFCPQCGERQRTGDYSIRRLLAEWSEDLFGVDGKLFRTGAALVSKPGLLTAEYLRGRRRRYVRPFQLFLVVNVIFLVAAISQGIYDFTLQEYLDFTPPSTELTREYVRGSLAETGRTYAEYEAEFNRNANTLRKGLIIILVPFLALVSWLLYFRRRRYYVQHVVFSVHLFAFYWLFVSVIDVPLRIAVELAGLWADSVLMWTNMTALGIYTFLALRRNYPEGPVVTALKTAVMVLAVYQLLRSYRVLLFFGTWAMT